MVNLISNEPKTGCYLLPILSNLQALKSRSSEVQELQEFRSPPTIRQHPVEATRSKERFSRNFRGHPNLNS